MGVEIDPSAARVALVPSASATGSSACCARSSGSRSSSAPVFPIGIEEVDELAAGSSERKVWTLADALVARDAEVAMCGST